MRAIVFGAALVLLPGAAAAASAGQALPAGDGKWELKGAGAVVERVDGREAIAIETGVAYRRDVSLEDGAVDFDVQVGRRRSFVYVMFRMADDREYEEMYMRPHKSRLPDAIQYAPVFQGQSAWQLHHGPGGTAFQTFEPGAWTHVRLVLQGRRAALFVGDMGKPALLVPHLSREPRKGYIALRGFTDVNGEGPIARFANVSVRPGEVPFDFRSVPSTPPTAEPGVVRAWAVSRSFPPADGEPASLPSAGVTREFSRLEAEPGGLLALHRYLPLPAGSRAGAAVARLHVRAAEAGTRAFDLGFSDVATVFLNGRPLFRGDASYSFEKRRDGLISFEQARLYLPLVAGDNELAVLLSDSFGGWGIMGRFPDATGLELQAR